MEWWFWRRLEGSGTAHRPLGTGKGEPENRTDEDGYLLPSAKTVAVALEIAARLRGEQSSMFHCEYFSDGTPA